MRTLAQLDGVRVSEWTAEEAFAHLSDTFEANCQQYPEIMEPYQILLGDAADVPTKTEIMRRSLRETFKARHMPHPDQVEHEKRLLKAERLGRRIDRAAEAAE